MKIYGYSKDTSQTPMELNEVTISSSPELLREIADFLIQCAKEIEDNKEAWEHEHFESKHKDAGDNPQFIVFNPSDN